MLRAVSLLLLVSLSGAFHQGQWAPLSSKLLPLRASSCPVIRCQLDSPTKIPDFFPSDWGRKGLEEGGGRGFRVPDTFTPDGMEREKQGGRTAVLERPTQKTDPGKKYKVLLFNDEKNTRENVIRILVKFIPGMTPQKATEITQEAHNSGMAVVGIWMMELAEAYSDVLRSQGLRSDIEKE